MAIALGGSTNLASGTGTRSWSSPNTANKAYGVVVISGGAVDETSGVTWGGVAMSREYTGANTGGENGTTSIWFLAAPGTGAQTVEITRSGSTAYIATAFDGTSATGNAAVETGNTFTSTSTNAVPLDITVTNGVVVAVYGGLYSGENALTSITRGADMTNVHSVDFGNFVSSIDQKTTTLTGTGSAYTGFNYTQSADDAGAAVIAIKEAAAATTYTGTVTADAAIAKSFTQTLTGDAFIQKTIEGSVTADAYLLKAFTQTITADAAIMRIFDSSFTADAYIGGTGVNAPIWVSPADGTTINATPVLVFTIPTGPAGNYHFNIQLDTANTFDTGNLRDIKTNVSQTGWEYWNGSTWTAFPSGGVASTYAGNDCRYTVQSALTNGTWYRRVRGGV